MNRVFILLLLFVTNTVYAAGELSVYIDVAREKCGNISAELNEMKTMAGINTAVTGVGTVAAGVGLGTGIAKSHIDEEIDEIKKEIERLKQAHASTPIEQLEIVDQQKFNSELDDYVASYDAADEISEKKQEVSEKEKKSKSLGNWRTGMLATSTATNIAGAVIAGNNRDKGDLQSQVNACLSAIKDLSNNKMQARISGGAIESELNLADDIVHACSAWDVVDLSSINKRSSGAVVSSGVGAGLGLVGTVVSASANTNSIRNGAEQKEKNLNVAANVLAGGTTVASGAAVIFNATQISAIKRAVAVAEECEGVLK